MTEEQFLFDPSSSENEEETVASKNLKQDHAKSQQLHGNNKNHKRSGYSSNDNSQSEEDNDLSRDENSNLKPVNIQGNTSAISRISILG